MILEGTLSEYPLRELLAILARKHETGLLKLQLESGTGNLFLRQGRLVNARVGSLHGLSAVNIVLAADEASFSFRSLPAEPEPAFNEHELTLLNRLVGIEDERLKELFGDEGSEGNLESKLPVGDLQTDAHGDRNSSQTSEVVREPVSKTIEPGVPPTPRSTTPVLSHSVPFIPRYDKRSSQFTESFNRIVFSGKQTLTYVHRHSIAAAILVLLFFVPAIIALTARLGHERNSSATRGPVIEASLPATAGTPAANVKPAASLEKVPTEAETISIEKSPQPVPVETKAEHTTSAKTTTEEKPKTRNEVTPAATVKAVKDSNENVEKNEAKPLMITVIAQIENGRVAEAYVSGHRPGMEAYEATAIRLARQRRFAKDKNGTERIVLSVSK